MKRFLISVFVAVFALACGGKSSMASKSAAAYRDAVAKGIPVAAGEHGGHAAHAEESGVAGMDHSKMTGMDHSKMASMDHSKMTGIDHSKMTGMDHSKMTGMDHSKMTGMDHSKMAGIDHSKMAGIDHSKMTGMDHSKMAGTDHSKMAGMSGIQHGAMAMQPMPGVDLSAPKSSSEIAKIQPAATLQQDPLDAPAPAAVAEATRSQHKH
jgi:hypothetical protein